MLLRFLVVLALSIQGVFAEGSKAPSSATEIENLKKVFNKMWASDSVSFDVQKKVSSELTKDKVYDGKFYFSKGRVKVNFVKPTVTDIVIDDEYIWHAQKLPEEFGGWQVSKIKKSFTNHSQALLYLMFGDQMYWDKLKIVEPKITDKYEAYKFQPKNPKDFPGITKLSVVIDLEKMALVRVSQWDELDNKVTYDFSHQDFSKLLPKDFFSYNPPKNVEVQNFN